MGKTHICEINLQGKSGQILYTFGQAHNLSMSNFKVIPQTQTNQKEITKMLSKKIR